MSSEGKLFPSFQPNWWDEDNKINYVCTKAYWYKMYKEEIVTILQVEKLQKVWDWLPN